MIKALTDVIQQTSQDEFKRICAIVTEQIKTQNIQLERRKTYMGEVQRLFEDQRRAWRCA